MNNKDLTQGNLYMQILFFSIPLVLSNLLQVLFNMSDVAVVGRFAGSTALGSVGSCTILVGLFTGLLLGMGSGINVLVARYLGAKKEESVIEVVHTSFIISFIYGLIILGIGQVLGKNLLQLLNTKELLLDGAVSYLRIYFLGMPALALFDFGNAVYSAKGNTKTPLIYLSLAGILNVCLNLLFVICFKMDVKGVALASILSQYISCILIMKDILRCNDCTQLKINYLNLYPGRSAQILSIGIPTGFQYAIFSLANLFIQRGVNSFDALIVEGNSAAANADNLVYDVMAAFYTANASFIGQNAGARNKKRILKTYFITMAYSFGIAAIMGLCLSAFGT